MRAWVIEVLAPLLSAGAALGSDVPTIPFKPDIKFFSLPTTVSFGEVAGVAVTALNSGRIYVYSRGNVSGPAFGPAASQLLVFDLTGKYQAEIGRSLYSSSFAHAVRVDRRGNIWCVDSGSDTVVKLDQGGRVLMVLGRRKPSAKAAEPWNPPPADPPVDGMFRQPTDIAWDAQENIYITDGLNARVAKLDKDGVWITAWGTPGAAPGQFKMPHGIAIDNDGRVYVADLGNRRVQVFDGDGKYLRAITLDVPVPPTAKPWLGRPDPKTENGAPTALCITPGKNPVLFAADTFPGRIYKLSLDGNVLGTYGTSGHLEGQFGWTHALACPSDGQVFVGELLNWRVQKLDVVEAGQ